MDLPTDEDCCDRNKRLQIECKWSDSSKILLPMPLTRAVFVLDELSVNLEFRKKRTIGNEGEEKSINTLFTFFSDIAKVEDIDLLAYKNKLLDDTTRNQANAAFTIVQSALSTILMEEMSSRVREDQNEIERINKDEKDLPSHLFNEQLSKDTQNVFRMSCEGIFHAANIDSLRDRALALLEGLLHHFVLYVAKNIQDFSRSEDNIQMEATETNKEQSIEKMSPHKGPQVVSGKLQPLPPFGQFLVSGRVTDKCCCFMFNEVVPKVLRSKSCREVKIALSIIEKLVDVAMLLDEEIAKTSVANEEMEQKDAQFKLCCTDIVLENLLHHMCEACLSFDWESRRGLYKGISKLLQRIGPKWSSKFEVVLVHISIFCLKDYPKEIVMAEKDAVSFFFEIVSLLYSDMSSSVEEAYRIVDDIAVSQPLRASNIAGSNHDKVHPRFPKSSVVCSMLIGELSSPNSVVR